MIASIKKKVGYKKPKKEDHYQKEKKKEKFRLTKNFTIELLLLLFYKLNQLEDTSNGKRSD